MSVKFPLKTVKGKLGQKLLGENNKKKYLILVSHKNKVKLEYLEINMRYIY